MMLPYFESMAAGIEAKWHNEPDQRSARKRFALEIARLGVRLFSGAEPSAWCGVLVPFDLLNAMGVASCFVEFVGATLASTGMVAGFLDEAEQAGYSTDGCSYHRSVMGAAAQGLMPTPDFLIATSTPCSGGQAVLENLSRHFGKDLFVIHVPQDEGEEAVRYLAAQFESMVGFAAAHTGKDLHPDDLRAALERTNRTREILLETYGFVANIPSPARRKDLVNFGIVMPLFLGTEGGQQVAEAYRDEFARKVKAGAVSRENERVRLLWLQNRIQFKNPLAQLLEEEYGAALVADELNDINWEPLDLEDPYGSLARRTLAIPLTGPAERRVANLERLSRLFKVDGIINPCHWGCRQGTGVRGLIQEGMKGAGVPVLNLEVDCVDPRNFSLGQIKTRLEAFIEMIENRRG